MIIGIGCDIISISRIKRAIDRNPALAERLFTPHELVCCSQKANPAQSYAARFAAKEAVLKALGTGWAQQLSWQEIEIFNNELGSPEIKLQGKAQKRAETLGATRCLLSLSHDADLAIAYVILE